MLTTRKTDGAALAGRILLSIIFIVSACAKIMEWNGTVHMMAAKGLPFPAVLLGISTAIELIGGLAMLLGLYSRLSATIVFLYLIPVTLIMHNFWSVPASQMNIQLVNFLKNLAIMGGLLFLSGFGPGRFALGREKYLYDEEYRGVSSRTDVGETPVLR